MRCSISRLTAMTGVMFLGIILLPCSGRAQSECPYPGGSGTTDGGQVTAVCGPNNTITGTCGASALTSYASAPLTNSPGEPQPCMDFYYNTADGPTNHNPTMILLRGGGNVFMGLSGVIDWSQGMITPNGTAPSPVYAVVDGSAFTGTASAGKHWNAVVLSFTLQAWGQLGSGISAGSTSAQVNVGGSSGGGGSSYWPNATGYNLYIGGDLVGPVTIQNGTWGNLGNGVFTLGWTTGIANAHPAGELMWAVGTDGSGAPTAPCTGQLAQVCDLGRALSYLTANSYPATATPTVPGNGHFYLWGASGGATTIAKALVSWKALLTACRASGLSSCAGTPNLTGTIDGAHLLSPNLDSGAVAVASSIFPNQVAPCSPITSWNFGVPAGYMPQGGPAVYTYSPPTSSVTSISAGTTLAFGGLPQTGGNGVFLYNRSVSAAGIMAKSGSVPTNSDNFIPKTDTFIGSQDNSTICASQVDFGATTPGATYHVLAGGVHEADIYTLTGGCSIAFVACYYSNEIKQLIADMSNLYVYGNSTASGIAGSGVF